MSRTRPPSPFLILLLGLAATGLVAEWLRFGWGPWPAAVPALLGTAVTLYAVARGVARRREWRARRDADRLAAARTEGHGAAAGMGRAASESELTVRPRDVREVAPASAAPAATSPVPRRGGGPPPAGEGRGRRSVANPAAGARGEAGPANPDATDPEGEASVGAAGERGSSTR